MKEKRRPRILPPLLLVCALLVSMLLSACATPDPPEESSVPMGDSLESSEAVPVAEDETAKAVRADLEELLEAEWSALWLTAERAGSIRESVKALKAPILTEEDVLRVAKRALALVATEDAERTRFLQLPACGVLAEVVWSSTENPDAAEAFYTALIAYTLYLFTPPEYVFRESELWGSAPSASSAPILYLPLAGDYTSRREALIMLQEGKNGVTLPVSGFGNGEHPLDCYRCGAPILFSGSGEMLTLNVLELARRENVTLPEAFFIARAEKHVWEWINSIADGENVGVYGSHRFPNGDFLVTYQLLPAETVREIQEMVELLPAPLLTEEIVWELEASAFEYVNRAPLLLQPGFDGAEDVLLPSGVESMRDFLMQDTESALTEMAHGAAAYLIDLFTPSAYRFPDLFGIKGVYYALNEEPESHVLITEAYKSGEGGLELLRAEPTMEERVE